MKSPLTLGTVESPGRIARNQGLTFNHQLFCAANIVATASGKYGHSSPRGFSSRLISPRAKRTSCILLLAGMSVRANLCGSSRMKQLDWSYPHSFPLSFLQLLQTLRSILVAARISVKPLVLTNCLRPMLCSGHGQATQPNPSPPLLYCQTACYYLSMKSA